MIKVDELRKHWDIRESNIRAEHKQEIDNLRAEQKEEMGKMLETYLDALINMVKTNSNLTQIMYQSTFTQALTDESALENLKKLKDESVLESLKKLRRGLPGAQ